MSDPTRTISTGEPSTLKTYRTLAALLFPDALPFLDGKIADEGEDSVVMAAESQMLFLLASFKPTAEEPTE